MTLQFRSRIKSVYDYGSELKRNGKCCFSDGTSSLITFLECFSRGGHFFQNPNAVCPSISQKGYCCSCSYLSTTEKNQIISHLPYDQSDPFFASPFGVRENITECECARIGGNWSSSNNDTLSLCQKNVVIDGISRIIDVRIPSACCSLVLDGINPVGVTCQNVCGPRECANLAIVESSNTNDLFFDTTYTQNKTCGVSIVSGVSPINCNSNNIMARIATSSNAFSEELFGPCYTIHKNNLNYSYDCSITTEFSCDGYWVNPESIDSTVAYCNHPYKPVVPIITNTYQNPVEYSLTEFNSLNLNIGDEFQGGIYIGKFKPSKPKSTNTSLVYGSLNFGIPQSIYVNVDDQSSSNEWAIIVNKTYLETPLLSSNDVNINSKSSYYDGYLNAYGSNTTSKLINSSTIKTISGVARNGFVDYYIPSIVEMMYFAEQLKKNIDLAEIFDFSGLFCSTTFFTDKYLTTSPSGQNIFNNMNFLYGLNFSNDENFGKSTLLGINTSVKLMLFRKIVLV